jgi:hypothetical protein
MMASLRVIRLPEELCARAEARYVTQFGSLEELVSTVLEELLRDDAAKLTRAEEEVIEERLRDLGYV